CGEDFEPTNYVIEDGVLYGFDPSRAALDDEQRKELLAAVNKRGALLHVQNFFRKHAKRFTPHAQALIPVSRGVATQYQNGIGRVRNVESDGNQVFNKFTIERASYTGAQAWPYLPGSSVKGCLRTALLDARNGGKSVRREERKDLEKNLLEGDFATSPLRLLKIADFMPCREPQRRVCYAVNHKKQQVSDKNGNLVQPKGVTARKETIEPGQYRAFRAEAVLPSLGAHAGHKQAPKQRIDLKEIVRATNQYHLARWQSELKVLKARGFVEQGWCAAVEKLLAGELKTRMDAGQAMLVRLGRYGGAESKTLTGAADIKIMQGKGQQPKYMSQTKTVWLAAETEGAQSNMLPFGWAIVEIDPKDDLPQLRQWCEEQAKGRPDMAQLRASFEAEKAEIARKAKEAADAAAARAAQAAAEQAAAEERARALQNMSEHQREIEILRDKCEAVQKQGIKEKANPGAGGLYQNAIQLSSAALDEANGWTPEEKTALADMLEETLPQVIEAWE
ncbi:MAG: hypothetical protein IKU14_06120, partial [Rhodocyclaceae bacterium]|nr:hypothetical protein [Rhodocyclaceae bacterium]